MMIQFRASIFALVILFADSCATNPVSKRKQVVFMSEEQEINMGKEADPQIVAEYGLYDDKKIQDFINEKGQEMVKISHRPNIEYHFRVVDSDILNAFAIPGGYVYFTRGIMAYINNEAEFAGVLGHEIGHVAARHSVEQQRNQIFGQIGLIGGVVLVPQLAQFAQPLSQGLGLLMLRFGRDAEREADKLGVEYSTKIGYDASEMAEFFHTLERQDASGGEGELPEFLSTHPNPGDRNKTVAKLAQEWKKKLNVTHPKVNRNVYLKLVDGLIYGEDPRQGYVESGVFYHPVLKFQFSVPSGWQYQNTPSQVQLASKDGKAIVILTAGKGSSLNDAAQGFHQQNNLQVVDSKETEVNGLKALTVLGRSVPQDRQQQVMQTLSYFIQHGENIYLLLGASGSQDFQAYKQTFTASQESFKQLGDQSKINKKPERVRVRTVSSSTTLKDFFAKNNVPEKRLEEHAILNGMQLNDKIEAGTLVKVIGE